jgi:O-antigen/teichoic acid export membrane protein
LGYAVVKEKKTTDISIKSLTAVFAGGNFLGMALRVLAGFLAARFVEPAVLGLFNGIGLVLGYAPFLQMGILNGLNRELPYYIGRGERERAESLTASAQVWAKSVGCIVGFTLLIVACYHAVFSRWELAAGWATYAFGAWALFYGQFYLQTTYRTHGDFAKLALINVAQNALSLILVVSIWLFGFYGLCLRSLIVAIVAQWLLWHWRPLKVNARWNKDNIIHLFKIGAPIFIVGQVYAWWIVLDSTLVLKYVGTKGLGLYQLAIMLGQALELFPNALSDRKSVV